MSAIFVYFEEKKLIEKEDIPVSSGYGQEILYDDEPLGEQNTWYTHWHSTTPIETRIENAKIEQEKRKYII